MTPSVTRTALVTGASTGIGRATALHLDTLGFAVFAGVRNPADGEKLARAGSSTLRSVLLDVTDAQSVAAAVAEIEAVPSAFVGVVNNAAISIPGPLEFMPIEEVRRQLDVNFLGAVRVTQAMLPSIRAAGRGRIVNVSSINARLAQPWIGVYSASKWAMEGWSDALRRELRPWNIAVSIVQPGAVATPIFERSRASGKELAASLPARAHELYPDILRALLHRPGRTPRHAIAPDRVARAIAKALTVRRPRVRYLVGRDTRLVALLSAVLPTRVIDRLL
ncbi:MAG: SDR family oxidoreductase [Gemmatimonadales bacterium]|jgi:NAD(P)-dependent dehydrogenase (short-subunit alcohol dehydrogenase family)